MREPDIWWNPNDIEVGRNSASEAMFDEGLYEIVELQCAQGLPDKYAVNLPIPDEDESFTTFVFNTIEEAEKAIKEHQQPLPEVPHD